jgi:hypothetical protein
MALGIDDPPPPSATVAPNSTPIGGTAALTPPPQKVVPPEFVTTPEEKRPEAPDAKPQTWVAPSAPYGSTTIVHPILTQASIAGLVAAGVAEQGGAKSILAGLKQRFGGDLLKDAIGTENKPSATPTPGYLGVVKPGQTWDQFIGTAFGDDLAKLSPEQRQAQTKLYKRTTILMNAHLATEINVRDAIKSGAPPESIEAFRSQRMRENIALLARDPHKMGLITVPSRAFMQEVNKCFGGDDKTFQDALKNGEFTYLKNIFGSEDRLKSSRATLMKRWADNVSKDPAFSETVKGIDNATGVAQVGSPATAAPAPISGGGSPAPGVGQPSLKVKGPSFTAAAGKPLVTVKDPSFTAAAGAPVSKVGRPSFNVGVPGDKRQTDFWGLLQDDIADGIPPSVQPQPSEEPEVNTSEEEGNPETAAKTTGLDGQPSNQEKLAKEKEEKDHQAQKARLAATAAQETAQLTEEKLREKKFVEGKKVARADTIKAENKMPDPTGKMRSGPLGGSKVA